VNRNAGNDSNPGDCWDEPLLTIAMANEKCETRNNDVIVFRGRLTSGNRFSDSQEITKDGVHLLGAGYLFGHGGGRDSVFVMPQTVVTPSNATLIEAEVAGSSYGGLILGANDIEVAGIYFYSPDATKQQCNIAADDSRYSHSIHDNWFQGTLSDGVGVASRTMGICLQGHSQVYIGWNHFDSPEIGVLLRTGSARYNHTNIIEHLVMHRPKYGVRLLQGGNENYIHHIRIMPRGALGYGYALTTGILLEASANDNIVEDCEVYNATKGTAYTNSGTANVLRRCYYDITAGAGTLFT
jgi:hypothetical protein